MNASWSGSSRRWRAGHTSRGWRRRPMSPRWRADRRRGAAWHAARGRPGSRGGLIGVPLFPCWPGVLGVGPDRVGFVAVVARWPGVAQAGRVRCWVGDLLAAAADAERLLIELWVEVLCAVGEPPERTGSARELTSGALAPRQIRAVPL